MPQPTPDAAARRAGRELGAALRRHDPDRAPDLGRVAGSGDAGDAALGQQRRGGGGGPARLAVRRDLPPRPAVDRRRRDARTRRFARSRTTCAATSTTPRRSPSSTYPLVSFLFEDEAGYCQQFAGSMGLMLRMLGIPARVVSGFAPGTRDADERHLRGARLRRPLMGRGLLPGYRLGHLRPDPRRGAGRTPRPSAATSPPGSTGRPKTFALPESSARVPPRRPGAGGVGAAEPRNRHRRDRRPGAADDDRGRRRRLDGGRLAPARRARPAASGSTSRSMSSRRRSTARLGAGTGRDPARRSSTAASAAAASRCAGTRPACARTATRPTATPPPGPAERRALRTALAGDGSRRRRLRALLAIPPGGPAGGGERRRAVRAGRARAGPLAVDRAAPGLDDPHAAREATGDWGPRGRVRALRSTATRRSSSTP